MDYLFDERIKKRKRNGKYAYPAVFKKKEDGKYTAFFWDLDEYCSIEADSFEEAIERAGFLLRMIAHFWEGFCSDVLCEPTPLDQIELEEDEIASFVFTDLSQYF